MATNALVTEAEYNAMLLEGTYDDEPLPTQLRRKGDRIQQLNQRRLYRMVIEDDGETYRRYIAFLTIWKDVNVNSLPTVKENDPDTSMIWADTKAPDTGIPH